MSYIQKWVSIFCISALFFGACEEQGPYINFEEETETATPQENENPTVNNEDVQKVVLLEEFTGVRCPNCPAGAVLAEQLADQYEGQVIIVSIHSGFFSIPYAEAENFKIEAGQQIENLLGKAAAYPSAAINRTLFEGENRAIIPSTKWNNYIKTELDAPVLASININTLNFDEGTLKLSTTAQFLEKVEGTVKLSVLLIEDGIISPQDVDGVKVDDYVHKHVLRAMLSPSNGVLLGLSADKDSVYQNEFTFNNFETYWDKSKMYVVAFVHGSGDNLSVLNAVQIPLIE